MTPRRIRPCCCGDSPTEDDLWWSNRPVMGWNIRAFKKQKCHVCFPLKLKCISFVNHFSFVFTMSHCVFGEECVFLTFWELSGKILGKILWYIDSHVGWDYITHTHTHCASAGSSIPVDSAQRQTRWVKWMLNGSLPVNKLPPSRLKKKKNGMLFYRSSHTFKPQTMNTSFFHCTLLQIEGT